ncbi:MAG TPA: hypothetical protein VLA17_11575 [Candidatus Limnocylindria bacterium]|nr:hypothetical protein [Candidatus Limnocylindria bacterium]
MRNKRFSPHAVGRKSAAPIKTTLMDLLREITRVTDDDGQVVAMVKNIFASHKVRLARSLAPVRLVNGKGPRRAGMARKRAAFA